MKLSLLGVGIAAAAVMSFTLGRLSTEDVHAHSRATVETVDRRIPDRRSAQILGTRGRQSTEVLTETVHHRSHEHVLRTTGTVQADENKVYRLYAGSAGRLVSLGSNSPGTIVHKDEVLATFFSNEFVKAEQAYFFSLQSLQRDKAAPAGSDVFKSDESVRSHEGILISMGMGEAQLRQLAKTRQATRDINITSPASGMVLSRNLYPMQVLQEAQEMYRIAGLDSVWVLANISPAEMAALTPNTMARVLVRRTGKVLHARVASSVPLANNAGQVLEVKLEVDNRDMALLPDMLVDVELQVPDASQITVPVAAVIDTGFDRLVYVDAGDGSYQPRKVGIGNRVGDRVIVRRGLSDGENVVVLGNFLLDSESRLQR